MAQAAAALDALGLVNDALAVAADGDGALGANVHAGVAQAALAVGRDADLLRRAGVAGEGDDVDEGRLVVFFGLCGLLDAVGGEAHLGGGAQGQAAGEAEALGDDGALKEDVVAVLGVLAGDDFVGQGVDAREVAALVGEAGDLCENLSSKVVNYAVYTSHDSASC